MSLFTTINHESLTLYLAQYSLGELVNYKGLSGGTVNSNYLVITTKGNYVLTLLEVMPIALAKQIAQLIFFLNEHDFPTPRIQLTDQGEMITLFYDKPTLIVEFIEGESPKYPTEKECFQVGSALGMLHNLTQGYLTPIENTMGHPWREATALELMPHFSSADQSLIHLTLAAARELALDELPKGIIHFDCFRDNTLFNNGNLMGIIDFYYACTDYLITDLSICINDWCTNWEQGNGTLLEEQYQALLKGYESRRPLTELEKKALPTMMQTCAMHFWIARTQTQREKKPGINVLLKNPEEYKQMLIAREQAR